MKEAIKGCTGCSACVSICPMQCIEMKPDEWGFLYPVIDKEKCIKCGKCKSICPTLSKKDQSGECKAYYGYHKDSKVRRQSSSGGAFTALAQQVLKEKGVVYGAIYDREKQEVYYSNTKEKSLAELRKSKYVQSEMKETLKHIKQDLEAEKKVMFVGTPCHVAGVSMYFQKHPSRENLLLCDFICHGVAPHLIFQQHIKMLEKKYHAYCKQVDFRPKTDEKHPWYKHHLKLEFENGTTYDESLDKDAYMICFMKENLFLRKSCYTCHYCEGNRKADITLADFWGITEYKPSLNDEKGLSLIITHTEKGEQYVSQIQEDFQLEPLEWRYAAYVFKKRNPEKYSLTKREKAKKVYMEKGYLKMVSAYVRKSKFKSWIEISKGILIRGLRYLKHFGQKRGQKTKERGYI